MNIRPGYVAAGAAGIAGVATMAVLGWNSERSYLDSATKVTTFTTYDKFKLGLEANSVVGGALYLKFARGPVSPAMRTAIVAFGAAGVMGLTYRAGAAAARIERHQELASAQGAAR